MPSSGFITAKAGRPDLYRAGAFVLRQLHSSSIPWAFRPPFEGDAAAQDQIGIFIPDFEAKASTAEKERRARMLVGDEESEDDEPSEEELSESADSEAESEDSADDNAITAIRSAFAALEVESGSDGDDSDDE